MLPIGRGLNSLGFHPWATYGLSPFSMGTKKPPAGGFLDGCSGSRLCRLLVITQSPLVAVYWLKRGDKAHDSDVSVPVGGQLG